MRARCMLALELSGVSFSYRSGIVRRTTAAVVDVSLRVREGIMLAIVGESGCGKSTLLRMIAGVIRPDRGTIRIRDRTIAPRAYHYRRDRLHHARLVQIISQHPELAFDPRQTIASSVREVLNLHRCPDPTARVVQLFGTVGLHEELHSRYPHELSGGQIQRAAIARALATGPAVLLLDEPTSMLDASVQARIIDLLQTVRVRSKVTMVLVTHDIELACTASNEIAVLFNGELVERGTAESLLASPDHQHTRALITATQALKRADGSRSRLPTPAGNPKQRGRA